MYKICLVGGEDSHKRIELSQYLIKAGFDVTIAGTGEQEFPENITYVKYNLNRAVAPIDDYKTIKWYRTFFTENHFDIIHTFDTKPAFLVPIALKHTKTPITRTITGVGKIFTEKGLFYALLRKLYFILHKRSKQRVNNTVFQNTDDLKLFLENNLVEKNKTTLILSSGIELTYYTQKAKRDPNEPFTFICVSRLVYVKGITYLIEAAKICKEKGYNFKTLLVGPLEENTPRFNKKTLTENTDVVEWLGQRSDVDDLLLKAHSFVLPTFGEGLPRVLLEAAATGLPIISTNVAGVRGFLKNEYDALIIEARDTEGLANALIRMYEDTVLAQKLVENAFKTVELYSLERVANQYITIFKAEIENTNS